MSHVPYEWVTSHMNESCPIWMSHVPYEWDMSHFEEYRLNETGKLDENPHTLGLWVKVGGSESCPRYTWVMSYILESCPIWMSHVPYEWVMSHIYEACPICMSHSPHILESCPVYKSHVQYERVVPYEWVMSQSNSTKLASSATIPTLCNY